MKNENDNRLAHMFMSMGYLKRLIESHYVLNMDFFFVGSVIFVVIIGYRLSVILTRLVSNYAVAYVCFFN